MSRFKRSRNRGLEQDVGRKQAAMLGVSPDQMMQAIDAKGGDFYRADLYPDSGAYDAYSQIGFTRSNSPIAGLQNDIVADMRRFYGFNSGQPVAREMVTEAAQRPAEVLYQSAAARPGPPAQHPADIPDPFGASTVPQQRAQAPLGPQTNAYPESMPAGPNPQQQAAIDLKDDYVNHTVGYDVQDRFDTILSDFDQQVEAQRRVSDTQRVVDERIKELEDGQWMTGSQTGDLALLGGSALLAGGGIGRLSAPTANIMGTDEDDRMEEARRNGSILN